MNTTNATINFDDVSLPEKFEIIERLISLKLSQAEEAVNSFNAKADAFVNRHLELIPIIISVLVILLAVIMAIAMAYVCIHPDAPKKRYRYYTIDELHKIVDKQRWLDSIHKDVKSIGEKIPETSVIPTLYKDEEGKKSVYQYGWINGEYKDHEFMKELFVEEV